MAQGMFSFPILKIQIRNPIGFSPDDTNTSCSAGDLLDVTRSIIDQDIARLEGSIRGLEDSIRALKSRRNELSPISRLPVEILCNIFSLSIRLTPESWTNFSQVSQHWRSLALSAAKLWNNIPLRYPRWAQEMLIRSKMAKLTLRGDFPFETPNPKTIETIRSCLCEMNRIEAIEITYRIPRSPLKEFFQDLPKSAPQLHTLRMADYSHPLPGAIFSIGEDFLYDTGRLRCVELIDCRISWDSPLLTGLTRLTLEIQDSLKENSSINQFLHALQRMPALTDLRLKDSIPDDSEGPSTYPVVDLPCLRVLNISSGVGALTAVLRHITFPQSAVLDLTCKEKQSTHQSTQIDFSNFLSVFATKFMSSMVFRSLNLYVLDGPLFIHNTHGLKFCLWTSANIHDYIPPIPQLRLILTWPSSPFNHENLLEVFTCAFNAMSLPFLIQLRIETFNYIDSPIWVKTFKKLPLLERVCVQSHATRRFFEALVYKTKAAKKSKTAYRNIPLPKLRYIHLEGADFGATTSGSSISVDMLLEYLMERCERDAEVQILRLEDCCSISSDDVARLKEIVVDVIWDGVEQEVSTQYDSEEGREYDNDGNFSNDLDDDDDYFSSGSGGSQ